MGNKSTANKWLIAAVVIMGIIIVAMATWIIAGAMHKNSDSSSSVKTSQTKKDSSDSLEKTRGEGEEPSDTAKKEYKDFRTKGDGTGIRLTSASDVDKLDIDSSLKKFLKSKVGQPIPGREGSVYEQSSVNRSNPSFGAAPNSKREPTMSPIIAPIIIV